MRRRGTRCCGQRGRRFRWPAATDSRRAGRRRTPPAGACRAMLPTSAGTGTGAAGPGDALADHPQCLVKTQIGIPGNQNIAFLLYDELVSPAQCTNPRDSTQLKIFGMELNPL